ncbi:MAG: hypothetical protein M1401_06890 [Chloroflexi bacterium]|nr:hypothetical protein [Chloroflexota bacterium]
MGALTELYLVAFAANKVEGFAQMQIIASSGVVLFAAWFLPQPWDLLVGLYPPYWAVRAYWLAVAGDPNWWLALLVGLAYMLAVLADSRVTRWHALAAFGTRLAISWSQVS